MSNAIIDNFSKEELQKIVEESTSLAEVIDKLGYTTHNGNNNKTVKSRLKQYNIDYSHFLKTNYTERNEQNVFCQGSTASQATLRRWYQKGQYSLYQCSICNLQPFWNGKELTLILDHINGINNDNRLENLRWVCPNCNQQLETTGFKKMRVQSTSKKYFCSNCGKEISRQSVLGLCPDCYHFSIRKSERPDRNILKELIRNQPFTQIGKMFNVTDNTVRKWCIAENLPSKKTIINKYSDEEWLNI